MKTIIVYLLVLISLVMAQALMEVPSSGGELSRFVQHSIGVWIAFFTGAFWYREERT